MGLNPINNLLENSLVAKNETDASQDDLKKACADFESIFLTYMLKSMRAGFSGSDPLSSSHESDILYDMLDEKLSEEIATSGGIGLATLMIEQLKGRK